MGIFVKICGITLEKDALYAVECGADAIGLIAYGRSPRHIGPDAAARICRALPAGVRKVGVFVDAPLNEIERYLDAGVDTVQLHGGEDGEFARTIPDHVEVWRAISPRAEDDVRRILGYPAERILVDAFSPDRRGGTGKLADWKLAKFAVLSLRVPVILAGGISPDNAVDAVREAGPAGLDVNSGVEFSPGVKDHARIRTLFQKLAEAGLRCRT